MYLDTVYGLFCVFDFAAFYGLRWKGGDTVRHIDDARMDMVKYSLIVVPKKEYSISGRM